MNRLFAAIVCALIACAMVGSVEGARMAVFGDGNILRTVDVQTGEAFSNPYSPLPNVDAPANPALQSLSVVVADTSAANGTDTVFVLLTSDSKVNKLTLASSGGISDGAVSGSTQGYADGAGTRAQFNKPEGMVIMSDGMLVVADTGNNRIRKVDPATGIATTWVGTGAAGNTAGTGTNAQINAPKSMVITSSGDIYVAATRILRKITPDGTVSDVAGNVGTAGEADGVGTNGRFAGPMALALSKDEKTLYVGGSSAAIGGGGYGLIRALTLETGALATVAGSNANTAPSLDGTGTNARFGSIVGLGVDKVTGAVVVSELGAKGGLLRSFDPASGAVTTLSGSIVVADAGFGKIYASQETGNGAKELAKFRLPSAPAVFEVLCNRFFAADGSPELTTSCADLKGTLPSLILTEDKSTITAPLTVAGALTVGKNAVFQVQNGVAVVVDQALALTDNAGLVVNGGSINAASIAMADGSVYQMLVNKATPGTLTATGAMALAGDFVLSVASDYDFAVGDTVTIFSFGSVTGSLKSISFLKLRGPQILRRNLLQAQAANGVSVSCTATSCSGTGTSVSGATDDDDDLVIAVALVIVSILLFITLVAIIFYYAAVNSKSKKRKVIAASGAPVSDDRDFAYSSDYEFGFPLEESSSSSSSSIYSSDYTYDYAPTGYGLQA